MPFDPIPVDPLVDAVFDVRTGYHVITKPAGFFEAHPLGEGNPLIFTIIRCQRSQLPDLWTWDEQEEIIENLGDGRWSMRHPRGLYEDFARLEEEPAPALITEHLPLVKLDLAAHKAVRVADPTSALRNVYTIGSLRAKPGSIDDFEAETRRVDTRKNAIVTVGTGKTHATITAAIAAASAGDAVFVYAGGAANVYAENVLFTKELQIVGMVANQGIKVTAAGGITFDLGNGAFRNFASNFEIEPTGATTYGLWAALQEGGAHNMVVHGAASASLAYFRGGVGFCPSNLIAYEGTAGGITTRVMMLYHCTVADCAGDGFAYSAAAGYLTACLASDNGGADFNVNHITSWCVSKDASAVGAGDVTGFDSGDYTDRAGDDYSLDPAKAATTLARRAGYPFAALDFVRNPRKISADVLYAGASDPDPDTVTAPTITVADNGDNQTFEATVDGPTGATNYIRFRGEKSSASWGDGGSISGDGTGNVSSGPGKFEVYAYSTLNGLNSPPSGIVIATVAGATIDPLGPGYHRWRYYTYNEATGAWTLDGDYPAPIQQQPIRDGRNANLTVSEGADGGKIMTRSPDRSDRGYSSFKWFREKSGSEYAIFHKLNEWIKTGAGIKIITHHEGVELMGFWERAWRTWVRTDTVDVQEYEPAAVFQLFPVDGTGAGW